MRGENPLAEVKRLVDQAAAALAQPGAGALPTLECRLADLQDRFLATRARSLADVIVRLEAIREVVLGLGEPGYLLHLVDAAINDLRALGGESPQS